ncbi:MAG: bifunctional phosphoglucose/phosphomannose isomerase [Candidatus Kapaibacterium sp.]|jgi:glucose/mannose-6-phosphate isomerase
MSNETQRNDPKNMHAAMASMGAQMRDAADITFRALAQRALPDIATLRHIIVAGMGGSAIGGEMARSYHQDTLAIPLVVTRSYTLPFFADESSLVIVVSYSGNTEETLAQYALAKTRGVPAICITSGGQLAELAAIAGDPIIRLPTGMQPRAALAYTFVPILIILQLLGLLDEQMTDINSTAALLTLLAKRYGNMNDDANVASMIANKIINKIPIIYSPTKMYDAVNLRWRGQMQENAKHLAFGNVVPEMNHIEISGFSYPPEMLPNLTAIFLRSVEDEGPKIVKRFTVLREMLENIGIEVTECYSEGSSRLERMFSLVALADWTSLHLAYLEGVDPTPIDTIEEFKRRLSV